MVFGDSRLKRNAIFVDSCCCATSFKNVDSSSKFFGVCDVSGLQPSSWEALDLGGFLARNDDESYELVANTLHVMLPAGSGCVHKATLPCMQII